MEQQIEIEQDNFSLEQDLIYLKSRMKYVLEVLQDSDSNKQQSEAISR
ncbi:hypothetical protein J4462_03760 [Candidatus Pacearchaeota archaeon]|nr:hypothetical protein [Candidatus Pacearchaeota archaeon]